MPAELSWCEVIETNRAGARERQVYFGGTSSMVNKISWQRAGAITEPGRYMFTFGWLTVTKEDLAIWKQFPDATFTLVELPAHPGDGTTEPVAAEEFHLGTFELPIATTEQPIATTEGPRAATELPIATTH